MDSKTYSQIFFEGVESTARPSAEVIVPLIISLTEARSVVDFGCGTGVWLAVFAESGVTDVLGLDGDWAVPSQLNISRQYFQVADLTKPVRLTRKFDLVVALEVAEHLPRSSAEDFAHSLVRAGDLVLFSAAVPNQGGTNHLNEQWPEFWIELFKHHGYSVHDCIRKRVWENPRVSSWYAQNAFLFVRDSVLKTQPELAARLRGEGLGIHRVVHPRLFEGKVEELRIRYDPVNLRFSTLLLALPRKAYRATLKRLR